MIRVGIMGATGYMGGEALRVLLDHPEVEIAWLTSRSEERVDDHHPNLYGLGLKLIHPDRVTPCDVVFLALPTGAAIEESARFLAGNTKVIDLGAAFRAYSGDGGQAFHLKADSDSGRSRTAIR
jgi:[amino group carrier protein]-6-phospho-L-2-aminoadipate/5-phospho-L-glutamate reductase